MVERLAEWFATKDYFKGVVLYSQCEHNAQLLLLFKNGPTPFNRTRLQKELQLQYELLKTNNSLQQQGNPIQIRNVQLKADAPTLVKPTIITVDDAPVNEQLYNAAKAEADKAYKEVMNKRAVLFNMAAMNDFTDPNTAQRIEERRKMSIEVVKEFNAMSALYEKANYVKITGRLPDAANDEEEEDDAELIPDHLVKQTLDNTRKNYNKMKGREQTPERILLLQRHERTIQILNKRWALLKQQ